MDISACFHVSALTNIIILPSWQQLTLPPDDIELEEE
jgi:hypothetical protein